MKRFSTENSKPQVYDAVRARRLEGAEQQQQTHLGQGPGKLTLDEQAVHLHTLSVVPARLVDDPVEH